MRVMEKFEAPSIANTHAYRVALLAAMEAADFAKISANAMPDHAYRVRVIKTPPKRFFFINGFPAQDHLITVPTGNDDFRCGICGSWSSMMRFTSALKAYRQLLVNVSATLMIRDMNQRSLLSITSLSNT